MSMFRKLFKKYSKQRLEEKTFNVVQYDKSYAIPKKLLRWTSIRMTRDVTRFDRYWDLFYWFEFANLMIFAPSEFFGMVGAASEANSLEDLNNIFRMIPCFGSTVLSIFKSFRMVYNSTVYENLVNELRTMWPRGAISADEHDIIHRSLNQLNFVVKGYFWCNNVLLVSFLSPPFFISVGRYRGYDVPMNLHFTYWLPFNPIQPVYYEIVLVLQTWHAIVVIFWNVAWDMMFCTLLCHITIQFDLLALRIKRIFFDVDSYKLQRYNPRDNDSNYVQLKALETKQHNELADIVLKHQQLIRLSGDMESMCSLTLLVNFMNGTITICFCGFCCILIEGWSDVAYKIFLLAALSQTWLLCWYGQKLIDSSLAVSEALYSCGWYNTSKKIQSYVLIMLHRAQRRVHLTTYGFSSVSLTSFSMIVKTSWSYFTLLLNFFKK